MFAILIYTNPHSLAMTMMKPPIVEMAANAFKAFT